MSQINFFLLSLCLVLFFSLIPSANAIIEKEYQDEIWSSINPTSSDYLECLFKVRLLIETDEDGNWTTDSSYRLYYFLEITYFNETHFEGDPLNFTRDTEEYIFADKTYTNYYSDDYFPHLLVNSPTNKQMTTIRFFPKTKGEVEIYPKLTIKDVKSHEGYPYPYSWKGQNVTIAIKSTSTTSSQELIFLATGTIFGVILIGAILIVKRRKK